MIRRNITFDDGTRAWLLISQVEHARISGELTRAWREPFSEEVLEAITHHDDGWRKWENRPQLDPELGRPLSFLETPIEDSLNIWEHSIGKALGIGQLAAGIVAGHFLSLASGSEQATLPLTAFWLKSRERLRIKWLAEWEKQSAENTPEVYSKARQMLLTADLFSLWLCMNGPITDGDDAASIPNSEMESRTSTVMGKFSFRQQSIAVSAGEVAWRGSVLPWPFAVAELNLEASALAVPAVRYQSWPEIVAVARPVQLRWQLRETLPGSGEC